MFISNALTLSVSVRLEVRHCQAVQGGCRADHSNLFLLCYFPRYARLGSHRIFGNIPRFVPDTDGPVAGPLVCPHHQIHHGEKLFLLPYIRSLILDKICHAPHQYSQSCSGSPDTAGVNMGVLCPGILPYLADLTQLSLAIHCASQPQAINPGMVTKNPFTAFIFH